MRDLLRQELMLVAEEQRPWREEVLLPIKKDDQLNAVQRSLLRRQSTSTASATPNANASRLKRLRESDIRSTTVSNRKSRLLSYSASPSERSQNYNTNQTIVNRTKENVQLIRSCVTAIVNEKVSRIRYADSKRIQTVLDNTLRTVEARFLDSANQNVLLDKQEVQSTAEKACVVNISLLFSQREFISTDNGENYECLASLPTRTAQSNRRALSDANHSHSLHQTPKRNSDGRTNYQASADFSFPRSASAPCLDENGFQTPIIKQ